MTRSLSVSMSVVVCLAGLPAFVTAQTNQAPVVETLADISHPEGEAESIAVVASDPEGSPLTYSASNLPPGVAINDVTGIISGTLTFDAAGVRTVTVSVTDGQLTTVREFVWTVTNTNRAPTLVDPSDRSTTAGYEETITLIGSDPDGDSLTYSATGLPPTVSINPPNGVISGTPPESAAGDYTVVATVSDGSELFGQQSFAWSVIATSPAKPTLSSPTTSIITRTPAFVWNAEPGTVWYLVRVTERTTTTDTWVTPTSAGCAFGSGTCSKTLGHDLDVGLVTWSVLAWNSFGYSPWSTTQPFVVDVSDLAAPQVAAIAPSGVLEHEWEPFQWSRVEAAVWYRLWRGDGAGTELERWFRPTEAGCTTAELCEVSISPYPANGSGEWKVQAWTASGSGPWSSVQTFTLTLSVPATPVPATPQTTLTDQTPTFTWPAVPYTQYYLLRIYVDEDTVDLWYTPEQADCAAGVPTCSARPNQVLSAGLYDWQLLAWNPQGYSQWSDIATFRVATAAPTAATLDVPTNNSTTHSVPIFRWYASANATYYLLRINDNDGTVYDRWFKPDQAGCPIGQGFCSANPVTLRGGPATWQVLTYNPIAYGPWSSIRSFVACDTETTPTTVSAPAEGQSGTIGVAVDEACGWTATSSASWVHVTSGASGSGSGTIGYTVDAHSAGVSRTATLTIDDVTVAVTQAPLCTYAVSPPNLAFPAAGGTVSVSVTAPAECSWTANSGVAWLTVASGGSGTGNGQVQYTASANGGSGLRGGSYTVAANTSIVYQAGTLAPSITPIAGGDGHTILVKPDGTLWTFGLDTQGQLGDGDTSTTSRKTPFQVAGITNVLAVAAGAHHSLALTNSGQVYAWGDSQFGQVGDGFQTDRKSPVPLTTLTDIVAIAAGEFHSVALRSNGDVYTWGRNNVGQLGIGSTSPSSVSTPGVIASGAKAIAAGRTHTLFVKGDGTAWAAGNNTNGKLGTGNTTPQLAPVPMVGVSNAIRVAAGERHSVILLTDGSLKAAGYNGSGQVGDNSTATESTTAVVVAGVTDVTAIAAGWNHTLALKADGTTWAWGANAGGQLGDANPPTTLRRAPWAISGLSSAAQIGAGFNHSLAVTTSGVVISWGKNEDGQLGDGSAGLPRSVPSSISGPAYEWRVATPMFSANPDTYSIDQTVVVTVDTPGATIHYTQNGAEPTETDPEVASGASIIVSSTQTLKAKAWKAGRPASLTASASYVMEVALPSVWPPATGTPFTSPQNVSITTTTAGATLYYTIDNTTPTTSSSVYASPIPVATTTTLKIIGVKSGWSTSEIKTAIYSMNFGTLSAPVLSVPTGTYEGSVVVTMSADPGVTIRYTTNNAIPTDCPVGCSPIYTEPLSLSTTTTLKAKAFRTDFTASAQTTATYTIRTRTPVLSRSSGSYAPGTGVTITSADPDATLRVTLNGSDPTMTDSVIASGTTLLVGDFTLKVRAFKAGLVDSTVVAATYTLTAPLGTGAIAVGDAHTILTTPGGLLYAWGENASGRLGDGTFTDRLTPKLISALTGVTALAAGTSHTLAATWDGRLFAWGNNGSGRLGDGTFTTRTSPQLIELSNVVRVAAGDSHSLALTADGHVYTWGNGGSGRLGQGSTDSYDVPTLVPGLSDVVRIAAGGSHSLAVTSNGQLYAWGANASSQLGNGGSIQQLSPIPITTPSAVREISAGSLHSVAIVDDGTVYTWGAGTNGQLGLGDQNLRSTPTIVPGLTATRITAGKNHTLALRTNGTLVSWGANGTGQLGYSAPNPQTLPTTVTGLPALAAVSAGGAHSAAVTPNGHVLTWGERLSGRLGDGSTTPPRPTPQEVFTVDGLWGATAAPLLSHSTGTYNTSLTVTVTHASAEAVLRYTTTGIEPTESDALVPTTGEIGIDQTRTLRVRAWSADRPPSAVVTANYTLQPATPTITPSEGAYGSPQTVTVAIAHTTPDATLRYTVDGTEPTASAPEYSGTLSIATSTVVKARVFRTGWSPSPVATGAFIFNFGQLAAPTASPGGGVDGEPTPVTLTAPAGVIRYTTDGTDPAAASSLYTAPLTFGEGTTTLKARAFQADWTPSTVITETYTLDLTPPTITAQVSPSPNAAGWHNTDVTITYICSDLNGIASCPDPVVVTQETNEVITRTATDAVGHQASASVTIRLDRTPSDISVTAPLDGSTTSAASVQVAAQVSDALSGITTATCNGVTATVSSGQLICTISLLPGRNSLVVFVSDRAGNGISSGVTITRTGPITKLRIDPATRTLVVGEVQSLTLTDDYGLIVSSAVWASNDANVVTVDASGVITAVATGAATITATSGGLEADALVTVVSGTALPFGATQWTVGPADGFAMQSPIYTHRVNETVPDMFAVESDGNGTTIVRALSEAGTTLWTSVAPGVPILGDSFGGIIAELRDGSGDSRGLARFGGPNDALPWRYESEGIVGKPVQAPDGTIYAIESVSHPGTVATWVQDKYVVVIDGDIGRLRARIMLPRNTYSCVTTNETAAVGEPVVGTDGYAYVEVSQLTRTPSTCHFSSQVHNTLKLMRVGPFGETSSRMLYEFQGQYAACNWVPVVGDVMPDGLGGTISKWVRQAAELYWCGPIWESNLTRFDQSGVRSDYELPHPQSNIRLVGEEGTIYLLNPGEPLAAIDVRNWATKWTITGGGLPVMALAGGGITLHDESTGIMRLIDGAGATTQTGEVPASGVVTGREYGFWQGVLGAITGAFARIVGPLPIESLFSYRSGRGNREGQGAADDLRQGIFAKAHTVQEPVNIRHIALRIVPANQSYWRAQESEIFDKPVPGSNNELFFGTLGAGPDPLDPLTACFGAVLKAEFNRTNDWRKTPAIRLERLAVSPESEDMWIARLIALQRNYMDNDPLLDYACPPFFPGEDGYNSNSYLRGLLNAAGMPLPVFPTYDIPFFIDATYPGWNHPVPIVEFDPVP